MSEQFAVRLLQPVDPSTRSEKAIKVAPRFGVGADKVEKLLSRNPGLITKPTSQAEAQRVATVFSSVGIVVEVVNLDAKPQAQPVLSAAPMAAKPEPAKREPAKPEPAKPEPVAMPVAESANAAWTQPAPRPVVPAASKPEAAPAGMEGAVRESVIWTPPQAPAAERTPVVPMVTPDASVATEAGMDESAPGAGAAKSRGRRFSLRWKLMLAAIVPIILLAITTLYIAGSSINSSTTRLLSQVGDNLSLTLASEMSAYIAENNLDLTVNADRGRLSRYFNQRVSAITPALHETAGMHLTDDHGNRMAGIWGPQLHRSATVARGFPYNILENLNLIEKPAVSIEGTTQRLRQIEDRFRETTEKAVANASFGDSAAKLAASLPARTVTFESFYMIGMPLANDAGTVHVILTEENIAQTSSNVLRPIIFAAAIAVALGLLFTVLLAVGLSRSIRHLASVADRISLGELDEPVEIKGNDEIRDVSESLERMRVSLQSAINRLRKRGRK
jgi:HAMP domain-containing protein